MDTSIKYGMTLSSEEHGPRRLVELATMAEDHGFDFVSITDHYHPWVDEQGHAPFVWSVLGAVAQATSEMEIAVGVTCPIMRVHPAVLAQATATTALLADGRPGSATASGSPGRPRTRSSGGRRPVVPVRCTPS